MDTNLTLPACGGGENTAATEPAGPTDEASSSTTGGAQATAAGVDPREGGFEIALGEWALTPEAESIRPGRATFVITNRGQEIHNFSISGVKNGAFINPGGSETWTVGLPAGRYDYVCDVPFHIGAGMVGTLVVTP